jgi:type I restriction enzyme S subunit
MQMANIAQLLTEHMEIWTAAETEKKSGRGRAGGNGGSVYGVKKLRELILELAVRGKLVPQDPNDEPASELLKRILAEKAKLIAEGKLKKEKPLAPITDEEKPFELPQGWGWTTLSNAAVINPRNDAPDDIKASFVPMTLIGTAFTEKHQDEIRIWKDIKKGFTHFSEGDIGVAKITPCFENSKACVFEGLKNGLGAGTTELHIVRPLANTLNPRYVLAYLKSPRFLEIGESKMTGTAGQKRLPKGFVELNPFPLPPLAEQHRIVAKVDELMALCDQLEQQHSNAQQAHETLVNQLLATLTQSQNAAEFNANWQRIYRHFDLLFTTEASIDALKQTLLQLAVMGKLVPQDPNDEPASELVKSILSERDQLIKFGGLKTVAKDAVEQGEMYIHVPSKWAFCRLGNLAKFIDYRGKTPKKVNSGVPLITAKNVRQGYISREPKEFVTPEEYEIWMTRGFPRIGDMLFTTEAPLGNIALIDIKEKFALAQRVICFQLHNQAIGNYLKIALMSSQVQQQFENAATGMTATGIKSSKLKEIPVPLPPLAEQHRIVAKVDALMALCDQLKTRLQQAGQQQQAIADALVAQAVQ